MTGRIILVRHGQTFSNINRALDTRPPGAELTERGREQAVEVGAELADLCADRKLSLNCSVALRAQQTAMLAAREIERVQQLPEHSLPVNVVVGVHEVFAGDNEMLADEDSHRGYTTALRGWLEGDPQARMPKGESYMELLARYQPVLEELAAGLDDAADAVLVSHGAAIRTVARHAAAAQIDPDFAFSGYLNNCRFVVLEPRGEKFGKWTVTRWADTELGG
ncbi:histidine phosphatase family protein [Corynebacterium incognita]|uniref:Histidine phosphatase family protein n=1 Tax=Corynebacterium incognita TaxID=2754725 RepID=A0A7G7CRW9_9CORY|nr:histidine phosphatase family protein [Corynebacterium incognita]QNE90335.1 histidine phosphatase family protein [Corynebacterium incognita]